MKVKPDLKKVPLPPAASITFNNLDGEPIYTEYLASPLFAGRSITLLYSLVMSEV